MKKLNEIKEIYANEVAKLIAEGYLIDEAYTTNSLPRLIMSKDGKEIEVKISTKRNHDSDGRILDSIVVEVDGVSLIDLYEIDYMKIYGTQEELEVIQEIRKARSAARYSKNLWKEEMPQSFVNRVKRIRGFGVANKNNLKYRRVNYGVIVAIEDSRTARKTHTFYKS